jgi:leukotriene-A4 hydrolase
MEDFTLKANHHDISSYSNFDKIRQDKIKIEARIDFEKKKFVGRVDISFTVLDPEETRIVLDSKLLEIHSVKDKNKGNVLKWTLYDENPDKDALGTPLVILLNDTELNSSSNLDISIEFSAGEASAAIQWLSPEQTKNKQYPFMFTQCEAILARTLLPCQDTPSCKVIVEAKLICENPLIALFSGIEVGMNKLDDNLTSYEYVQNIPIPTYLIAVACGELEYGKLSERCGVWTEVGLRDKAVWEFQNTEEFLRTAENYVTPYVWGVYNILVLPFSFPYGGMENPALTFVTPALLAGDRSMTNVVAHEISHSWTGNLVTNKNWVNFWMNEGFTMFLERKIIELMYGEDMSLLDANVGKGELKHAIQLLGEDHTFTSLNPELENIDPDDAFSVVPYEKGFTFLYYLETLVGKENFQIILQDYIKKYSLKSVTHLEFKETFENNVKSFYGQKADDILNKVQWDSWIKTRGYPIIDIEFSKKKYFKFLTN